MNYYIQCAKNKEKSTLQYDDFNLEAIITNMPNNSPELVTFFSDPLVPLEITLFFGDANEKVTKGGAEV